MDGIASTTGSDLTNYGLKSIASGKVRDLYEVDSNTLLLVVTDRISAYDVILDNVRAATITNDLSGRS